MRKQDRDRQKSSRRFLFNTSSFRLHTFLFVTGCLSIFLWAHHPSAGQISSFGAADDWPVYGHDAGGARYSPLTQINKSNVGTLKVAWVYHTGDISDGSHDRGRSGFEATPILVDGTLYFTTGFNRVIALDPETGKQLWAYDPMVDQTGGYGDGLVNRGVATWLDDAQPARQPCHRRIFESTLDARLIALDALTGAPCAD